MKDLQEMNLVDDFLVNSLTSHKTYGESASRYILECIFRRKIGKLTVVPQRFLYTKGTKGDPPRELRELLRYMEDSTEENAGSEGLKTLHRMVTEVKRDGEVGFAYMKSFEREQRVREEARQEGLSEGLSEGRREGLSEGLAFACACLRKRAEVCGYLKNGLINDGWGMKIEFWNNFVPFYFILCMVLFTCLQVIQNICNKFQSI